MKQLRLDNGLSRADLARELGCAPSKIGHIEMRVAPVRKADLLVMLGIYKVPAEEQVWYLDMCERAKKKGWWDGGPGIPDWFSALIGLEAGACEIQTFEISIIPGLLQTPAYMETLFHESPDPVESETHKHIEYRSRRQQRLQNTEPPLRLHAIVDEAPQHRMVGSPEIMREQLRHLAEINRSPQVTIQIIPFARGAYPGLQSSFHLLRFAAPADAGVVYLETQLGGLYLEEEDEVAVYSASFERLAATALSPRKSASMIETIAKEL